MCDAMGTYNVQNFRERWVAIPQIRETLCVTCAWLRISNALGSMRYKETLEMLEMANMYKHVDTYIYT